jgi:hypothetical protein
MSQRDQKHVDWKWFRNAASLLRHFSPLIKSVNPSLIVINRVGVYIPTNNTLTLFYWNHPTDHLPFPLLRMFYINYATAVVYQLPLVQSTHENTTFFIPSLLFFLVERGEQGDVFKMRQWFVYRTVLVEARREAGQMKTRIPQHYTEEKNINSMFLASGKLC